MIKLNGEELEGMEGKTLSEVLSLKNYKTDFIAVEYNGEILPKNKYPETIMNKNDLVEVVSFVGGG